MLQFPSICRFSERERDGMPPVNPGGAPQRFDHESGIVGQGREAQHAGREMRFFIGIFIKSGPIFLDFRYGAKIIQVADMDRESFQQVPDFSCFASIARCQDKDERCFHKPAFDRGMVFSEVAKSLSLDQRDGVVKEFQPVCRVSP